MKVFSKIRYDNGYRDILFCGIRIFRYKKPGYVTVNWQSIEDYIKSVLDKSKPNACKLVVVPSDSIKQYDDKGQEDLESYYNPTHMFDLVFVLSPKENGIRFHHGMHIIGVDKEGDCYKRALNLIKPDIVRAYGGYWATKFIVDNRTTTCPIVSSVHDARDTWLYDEIRGVDAVICVSKTVVDLVQQRNVAKNKIILMYDRVDRNVFRKIDSNLFDKKYHNIVCVARLSPEKNHETLLKALDLLGQDYHCFFIGQGSNKQYKKLAKDLGILRQTHWIPRVANSQLPQYYSGADCMCVPSLCEGFGIVFIEAAACECPVVTSDIPPMNIIFQNKKSAMLVEKYTDAKQVADAIRYVCTNKDFARTLGKHGRSMTKPFDKKDIEHQEAEIYKKLMHKK